MPRVDLGIAPNSLYDMFRMMFDGSSAWALDVRDRNRGADRVPREAGRGSIRCFYPIELFRIVGCGREIESI